MNHPISQGVVIDLETTGLHARTDKIIEIGALKIREGRVVETYSQLLYPGFPLADNITQITGITDEMLKGQKVFADIAEELLAFLGEDILIGHSITGDYAFLKKAFVNQMPRGFSFEKKGIDTLKLARRFRPPEQKKTLSGACGYFGYSFDAHRAMGDAEATFFLLKRLYEEYGEKDPEAFAPLPLRFAVKRDSPIMEKQIRMLQRLFAERGIDDPVDLNSLTKSQASRMIDKLKCSAATPIQDQPERTDQRDPE